VAEIWDGFKGYLLQALVFLYGGVKDYGAAIVLLTVAIRIVLTPLVWKQTKSMLELQKVQPKIKALQEKHKNNKEKQQEELMKFYQENKVNPFGGCLPLILQMPVFLALYQVLGSPASYTGPSFAKHLMSLPPAAQEAAKRFWIILPDLTRMPSEVWTAGMKAGGTRTIGRAPLCDLHSPVRPEHLASAVPDDHGSPAAQDRRVYVDLHALHRLDQPGRTFGLLGDLQRLAGRPADPHAAIDGP
jgi:YidC/Oxa1 family membrane protein insertase